MTYVDKHGRWHHKEVTDRKEYPSNNAWYYSAVAMKLGIHLDISAAAIVSCFINRTRHPLISQPVISRDEWIGIFQIMPAFELSWNFSPYPLPRFNPIQLIKEVNGCVETYFPFVLKHRNTFWENNYSQLYRFAFMVPFSDRHYLLRLKKKYNPIWHLVHIVAHWKKPEKKSARLLRWFKTGKDFEAVANYFGEDHPFSKINQFDM